MAGTSAKKAAGVTAASSASRPARIRTTNKSLEARQFSTVRLPRSNEAPLPKVNVDAMFESAPEARAAGGRRGAFEEGVRSTSQDRDRTGQMKMSEGSMSSNNNNNNSHSSSTGGSSSTTQGTTQFAFDPIPNDPMFIIVPHSQYWPPPSLEALAQQTGLPVVGQDGFDTYDRRADDAAARRAHSKVVKGELNHPRGKPRRNTITHFEDSDSSSSSGGGDGDGDSDAEDEAEGKSGEGEEEGVSDESCDE